MITPTGFRLPRLCLPRPDLDLSRWAVVACDQYTSEPEYWQPGRGAGRRRAVDAAADLPRGHLGAADAPARIAAIQAGDAATTWRDGLLRRPRWRGAGRAQRRRHGTRRGLMLELDLEHYDFSPTSTSLIRPTEGTIVARLAPRIACGATPRWSCRTSWC
jgi:hypothetical protein